MNDKITVIDYGTGNLLSVIRAFEYWGTEVLITNSPRLIESSERLVLPGVGAFSAGMAGLNERGLIKPIQTFIESGRPFLGICLGMQLMLEGSEEFGVYEGLGLIPGKVVPIPSTGTNGKPHKIPHIGWNYLQLPLQRTSWDNTILKDLMYGRFVYFVHSYAVSPTYEEHTLANTFYDGYQICAVIKMNNIYGCQFHPEKSGPIGLKIIKNFLELPVIL